MQILSTDRLTKRYGGQAVVNGVSLTVQQGDIYGFLGPNGAGKTTTIRMLLGLTRPSGGRVCLLGQDPLTADRSLFKQVGSLIEGPAFWPHLSAAENMVIIQKLKGGTNRQEITATLELVGLADAARKPVKHFSLGMKQRLGIGMALLGKPRLLVLDEPTNGLDPEGFREMRSLLRRLVTDQGMTVLLSSHLLSEVEQVATRIGVIQRGRLVTEATVADLRGQGGHRLEVTVSRPDLAATLLRERLNAQVEPHEDGTLVVRDAGSAAAVNSLLVRHDLDVSRLVEREASLEEIFFNLTGGETHVERAAD